MAGVQRDAVRKPVGRDHPASRLGDLRNGLAGGDGRGAGSDGHHGQQARPGADVQHPASGRGPTQGLIIGVVAGGVGHHREVPGRGGLGAGQVQIVPRLHITRIDLQGPAIGGDRAHLVPGGFQGGAQIVDRRREVGA